MNGSLYISFIHRAAASIAPTASLVGKDAISIAQTSNNRFLESAAQYVLFNMHSGVIPWENPANRYNLITISHVYMLLQRSCMSKSIHVARDL